MANLEERLKKVVCDTLNIDDANYDMDLSAGDIPEWDSIGHVNLLMAVEKEFGVAFDIADAIDIESVGDFPEIIQKYLPMPEDRNAA